MPVTVKTEGEIPMHIDAAIKRVVHCINMVDDAGTQTAFDCRDRALNKLRDVITDVFVKDTRRTNEHNTLVQENRKLQQMLDAAKAERDLTMPVFQLAMRACTAPEGSENFNQALDAMPAAADAVMRVLDEQCKADYEHQPGEVDWALFADGVDIKASWERVRNLIAEAKANGR